MTTRFRSALCLSPFALAALLASGCAGELASGASSEEGGADGDPIEYTAESAVVGGQAKVTASVGLNLRTGPSTDYKIIVTMPNGAVVDVTGVQGGWYKVTWSGKSGWCSGTYLTPVNGGGGGGGGNGGSAVDQAMSRAESGLGFSYHWGGGCWDPGSSSKGACYGNCPNCTHSGQWGADCSGYVAKAWQVPVKSALTTCQHPYSTYNFRNERTHWSPVSRGSVRRGDALVHHDSGAGHIFLVNGGDGWGWMTALEAKGCSYGILKNSRTAGSNYIAIRREGF